MSLVRSKNTRPELAVRAMIRAMGFRYRLHGKDLPGCPDIVFRRLKKAVYVSGCFWHRHPGCPNARWPKSKLEFWKPKLKRNRARDLANHQALRRMGWSFLVIWKCELKSAGIPNRLAKFLSH